MALKMGMQGYLFSESTPEALKNKPDEFYDNIVDILSSLEIAAAALQEIQVRNFIVNGLVASIHFACPLKNNVLIVDRYSRTWLC